MPDVQPLPLLPMLGLVLASYLLGSVPCGLLLGKARGVDVRRVGSGNIGATNVGRALGRPWALVAFACDFGKGLVPSLWLAPLALSGSEPGAVRTAAVLAGGAAVCGHVWPIYLRFRGGKGVATGCGALVGLDPLLFLAGGVVWLVTLGLFRMVGLASIAMGVAFPVAAWLRRSEGEGLEVVLGSLALTLLVLARHRANMTRMLAGTEPKVAPWGKGNKR